MSTFQPVIDIMDGKIYNIAYIYWALSMSITYIISFNVIKARQR